MKIYKFLFLFSLLVNMALGFFVYNIPNENHIRLLREAKYLLTFAEEIIVENKAKVNLNSKFMKGYVYQDSSYSDVKGSYSFNVNEEINENDYISEKNFSTSMGFLVEVGKDGVIKSLGWDKP